MRATRYLSETDFPSFPSCSSAIVVILLLLQSAVVTKAEESKVSSGVRDVTVNRVCDNFTYGSNDREFVSPNYPNNYPNDTRCYKTIEAPHGYVIRLEFREHFNVEPSPNCNYDYLEVRDGAHGYAKLIGQFCGHSFPGEVTSSDRYLWLRFVSDEYIEYGGFKVAYKFVLNNAYDRPEMEACHFFMSGPEGLFGSLNIPEERYNYSMTYNVPLNCLWEIEVQDKWKISLTFVKYKLREVNECEMNFIDVFQGSLEMSNREAHFCGSVAEPIKLKQAKIYVLFYASHMAVFGEFTAFYTAFRDVRLPGEDCDPSVEFDCKDNTCIDISLHCNDRANCKYGDDEAGCTAYDQAFYASQRVIVILMIGLVLLLSITIPSCWNCYRKWQHRHQNEAGHASGGDRSAAESVGQRTAEGSLHESHILNTVSGGQTNDAANVDDDDDNGGCYVPEVDLSVFLNKRSNGGHAIMQDDGPPFMISRRHEHDDSILPFDSTDPLISSAPPPPALPTFPPSGRYRCSVHPNNPSLYNELPIRKRSVTPPPPPPPPPPSNFQDHNNVQDANNITPGSYTVAPPTSSSSSSNDRDAGGNSTFQTFLPPPPTDDELEEADDNIFGLPPSAPVTTGRANASLFKAEAGIEMQANRPRSFESTKSAPEVVNRR